MLSGATLQKYGPELEKHQYLLLNASEILIQVYMAESAILRAEKLANINVIPVAIAKLNLFKALKSLNL